MRKVLIVTRGLLTGLPASLLDRRSIRVRTADDTDDAARIALAWPPDLVIASAGSARAARDLAPGARLLVIGAAGDGSNADAHVSDPGDVEALLSSVSQLLDLPARLAPRLPADFMAKLACADGATVLAHIVELSATGLLVECEDPVAVHQEVVVEFHLPGQTEPVTPKGRIVSMDEAQRRVAIAFFSDDSEHRDAILVYVELQTAARAEVTRRGPEE